MHALAVAFEVSVRIEPRPKWRVVVYLKLLPHRPRAVCFSLSSSSVWSVWNLSMLALAVCVVEVQMSWCYGVEQKAVGGRDSPKLATGRDLLRCKNEDEVAFSYLCGSWWEAALVLNICLLLHVEFCIVTSRSVVERRSVKMAGNHVRCIELRPTHTSSQLIDLVASICTEYSTPFT